MSILIKGTTMPKNCNACLFTVMTSLGDFCNIAKMNINYQTEYCSKHPECPLIEVPTPHGRLIDADALEDKCYLDIRNIGYNNPHEQKYQVLRNIANAPTIIESEGKE